MLSFSKRIIRLIFWLAVSSPAFAQESHFSANGSHAWFLGEKLVTYCVSIDESAKIDREKVKAGIQHAVNSWFSFYLMNKSKISGPSLGRGGLLVECDENTELVFYLGVTNKRILKDKSAYSSPLAFSHLESYDESLGRGKGYVWVDMGSKLLTDRPKQYYKLLNFIFLHEVGHVFGCGHVSGTIMREDIYQFIKSPHEMTGWARKEFPYIPHERKLLNSVEMGAFIVERPFSQDLAILFKEIVGYDLSGSVEFHFRRFFQRYELKERQFTLYMKDKGTNCQWDNRYIDEQAPVVGWWRSWRGIPERCGRRGLGVFTDHVMTWQPVGEKNIFVRKFQGQTYATQASNELHSGWIQAHTGKKVPITLWIDIEDNIVIHANVNGSTYELISGPLIWGSK